jgi:hypothetical protein
MEPIKINMGCWVGIYTCPDKDCSLWSNEEEAIRRHLRSNQAHRPLRKRFVSYTDPDWDLDHECIVKKYNKYSKLMKAEAEEAKATYIDTIGPENISSTIMSTFMDKIEGHGINVESEQFYALLYYFSYTKFCHFDNIIIAMRLINLFASKHRLSEAQSKEVLNDIIRKSIAATLKQLPLLRSFIEKMFDLPTDTSPFSNKLTYLSRIGGPTS